MPLYEMIKDVPMFQHFSEEEKKIFARGHHKLLKFKIGEAIITEGDQSSSLYLLISGTCLITKTQDKSTIRLSKLKQGELFGEMSFFTKKPRKSNVIANDDVTVLKMDKEFFAKVDPDIRDGIKNYLIELLIQRLDNMNAAIMRISKLMHS